MYLALRDGPRGFRPGFTCPNVLRCLTRGHQLSRTGLSPSAVLFPVDSASDVLLTLLAILVRHSGPTTPATQRPVLDTSQVWAVPVSLATTQGIDFSFSSPATEMFHFAGLPLPILCVQMGVPLRVGFPIRKSPDQSLLAAPRSLSQLTTSFIGIRCQGIHHVPLVA
jgi:hypothetical protein